MDEPELARYPLLESSPQIWARASRRWTTYACGCNLHHMPLLTTPLQEVATEIQGEEIQDRLILAIVVCQVIDPRNKPLRALLVQGKLPRRQPQTQTHAHLLLSYGAHPSAARNLASYTAEAQSISSTNSGLIDTDTRDPAKDCPTECHNDRPDNG